MGKKNIKQLSTLLGLLFNKSLEWPYIISSNIYLFSVFSTRMEDHLLKQGFYLLCELPYFLYHKSDWCIIGAPQIFVEWTTERATVEREKSAH